MIGRSTLLYSLRVGRLSPLGATGLPSGIHKRQVECSIHVLATGLEGDEQGDTRHHGGPEKAIHHYAFDHYAAWEKELPQIAHHFIEPGSFGENVSTLGLTERDVCIGDIFTFGTAVIQVSQGRQPCWRLNARFGVKGMARRVQESLRTGWYYRVLESGVVAPTDTLRLIDRPCAAWTVHRVLTILYRDQLNFSALADLVGLELLTPSWRELARRRIERGTVENWQKRLGDA